MRRVLDCRALRSPATDGISTYILGLARAWVARPDTRHDTFVCFEDAGPALEQVVSRSAITTIPRAGRLPFVDAHLRDAQRISKIGGDLLYVLGGMPPLFFRGRYVQVVHDVLIYEHPEWFPSQPFATRVVFPHALKRAERIVAVSEATKEALGRSFSVSAKTTVIPSGLSPEGLPINTDQVRSGVGITRPYFLCLGTLEPRKNLLCALRAFASAVTTGMSALDLVIVGARGWKYQVVEQEMLRLQAVYPGRVHWLGSVTDQEKQALLSGARALLFPSLGEGFGYPPLEAAQYGVPSVVSDIPVLRETLGDAAIFLDPTNVAAWTKQISDLVVPTDEYRSLGERAQKNTARYTWERTVESLLRVAQS